MTRDIVMTPSSFGPGLHEEIRTKLKRDVEGTTDGKYGFIIMVDEIYPIERGIILEGGGATFDVSFRVVVYRPFKHEVIDAIVTGIDSIGFRCEAGPLKIIVTKEVCIENAMAGASTAIILLVWVFVVDVLHLLEYS